MMLSSLVATVLKAHLLEITPIFHMMQHHIVHTEVEQVYSFKSIFPLFYLQLYWLKQLLSLLPALFTEFVSQHGNFIIIVKIALF